MANEKQTNGMEDLGPKRDNGATQEKIRNGRNGRVNGVRTASEQDKEVSRRAFVAGTGAAAAGVVFDVQHDGDGTIDWAVTSGGVDRGETVAVFYRSGLGPAATGPFNMINAVAASGSGPAPGVPEPTGAAVFGLGAVIVGLGIRRRLA